MLLALLLCWIKEIAMFVSLLLENILANYASAAGCACTSPS